METTLKGAPNRSSMSPAVVPNAKATPPLITKKIQQFSALTDFDCSSRVVEQQKGAQTDCNRCFVVKHVQFFFDGSQQQRVR